MSLHLFGTNSIHSLGFTLISLSKVRMCSHTAFQAKNTAWSCLHFPNQSCWELLTPFLSLDQMHVKRLHRERPLEFKLHIGSSLELLEIIACEKGLRRLISSLILQ